MERRAPRHLARHSGVYEPALLPPLHHFFFSLSPPHSSAKHQKPYNTSKSKTYLFKTLRKTSKMSSNQQSLPQAIPIVTAQHAYYNSPLGSPTSTDGSFSPVLQSKSNDLVRCTSHEERPELRQRATNAWGSDRKSTESEDSKRPAFRRTGRHSGEWLFGGFSFRQTAKRVMKNFE